MRPPKYRIDLCEDETAELQRIIRRHSTAQTIVKRAQIILLANGEKKTNSFLLKVPYLRIYY